MYSKVRNKQLFCESGENEIKLFCTLRCGRSFSNRESFEFSPWSANNNLKLKEGYADPFSVITGFLK